MAMRPTATTTIMTNPSDLLRLMAWLSPVFPTGGFAYSQGLEQAVADDVVPDKVHLETWLSTILNHGAMRQDCIMLTQAYQHHTDEAQLAQINALALALIASHERYSETTDQAASFIQGVAPWFEQMPSMPPSPTLPIALGICAAAENIALETVLIAYMQNYTTNQLQAAIRLSIIGQRAATEIMAALEAQILNHAGLYATSTLEDIGTLALGADIASMRHETLTSRLFIS